MKLSQLPVQVSGFKVGAPTVPVRSIGCVILRTVEGMKILHAHVSLGKLLLWDSVRFIPKRRVHVEF